MSTQQPVQSATSSPVDPKTIIIEPAVMEAAPPRSEDPASNVVQFLASDPQQGGEGGKGEIAPIPPSPPSTPPVAGNVPRVEPDAATGDVYRPAPKANPVVTALREAGLYRAPADNGRHQITCPWAAEHAAAGDAAHYVEPGAQTPQGQFKCGACEERNRHIGTLLDHLGTDPSVARCKPTIRTQKGELHRVTEAAERVLAESGDYYHSGAMIVQVKTDPRSGDVTTEQVSEQALTIALSSCADWESFDGRSKGWCRVDVPQRIVTALMRKGEYRHLRDLNGLARQPFLRRGGNELVAKGGYDTRSGMLAAFDASDYVLPEPTEANARAALDVLDGLLAEFHFASPNDRAGALSAILTATIRSSLPLSPAFSISASRPGSGKSYLASLIGCFAGPGDPYNISYPTTAEEASKLSLSVLTGSPAVVCFDDMTSDWMAYGAINRLLTSETITERVLGVSRIATVRTTSFIIGTGNNIRPLRDLCRRVVSIYLSPRVENITSLRYSGKPVQAVKADRARFVRHALTIVTAYIAAGSPTSDTPAIPTYDDWSSLCRDSLIWLGLADPAASLIAQVNDDPDVQAFGELLAHWRECFRDRPTMVRTLIDKADTDRDLKRALEETPAWERGGINPSKLGRYLARHANRIVNGLELRQSPTGERNAWTVVAVDDALKARPPSPREQTPDPAGMWGIKRLPDNGAAPGEIF